MRNKQNFLDEITPLVKSEFRDELNPVEDAAHTMNHLNECKYVLPSQFSVTDKDETFLFEKGLRSATDNPEVEVEDFFFIGKDGAK
ncbi:hypothetical protein [Vagococcus fluvialis]|uniref:hypothetical protein n=1 Tax=Vagococcus fluvialis TaxID=2738 RepID=UPI001D0A0425|nr:hypothetical protein [Vagococcus fluvialis]UDM72718.1 hypothetical protein K5L00_15135 [Vagococcus fluvialis]UDM78440.1 hypothetical protein K5K98_14465 [Vagococcus fluvialis]UDM83993.1 hypothetical protein K5K96_14285 [Vagococcus fluvialis]